MAYIGKPINKWLNRKEKIMKTYVVVMILFVIAGAIPRYAISETKSQFSEIGSEYPEEGAIVPNEAILNAILHSMNKDEIKAVRKCAKEYKLEKAELPRLFLAYPTNLNDDDASDYLVVPNPSKYFCIGLNGAHAVAIWAIAGGITFGENVFIAVLHSYNDQLTVLRTSTNGWRDLQTDYYVQAGAASYRTVWKFNGIAYLPTECSQVFFEKEKVVKGICEEIAAQSSLWTHEPKDQPKRNKEKK